MRKIYAQWVVGDHIFGIAPLMAGCMNGAGGMIDGVEDPRSSNMSEYITVCYYTNIYYLNP